MKTPTYPTTRFPKQNIYQLAKVARRLPRVISRNLHKLTSNGKRHITPRAAADCRMRIAGARMGLRLLNQELLDRNIHGNPLRDTTPHRLRGPAHFVQLSTLSVA